MYIAQRDTAGPHRLSDASFHLTHTLGSRQCGPVSGSKLSALKTIPNPIVLTIPTLLGGLLRMIFCIGSNSLRSAAYISLGILLSMDPMLIASVSFGTTRQGLGFS